MKILALDLSTKSSGWAIYSENKLEKYGCISSVGNNLFKRINKMIESLEEIIQQNKIDRIVIEDVLPEDVKHNQKVFKALTYLQGFVLNLLDKYNLDDIQFYTSSEWRKKCGIRTGRAIKRDELKVQDIKFVKDSFNIDVNDDVADAICIGYADITKEKIENKNLSEYDEFGFEFK